MAGKKKKAKKLSITKPEPHLKTSTWPWSQLPQNLVQISYDARTYFHSTTSRGTTKTWRITTSRCNAISEPHQLLQLINHDSISNLNSSTASACPKNLHYLDDISCILSLSRGSSIDFATSYWTILKVDTTSGALPSPTPSLNYENIDPHVSPHVSMGYVSLVGDDIPTSSLMVHYIVNTYKKPGYKCGRKRIRLTHYRSVRHECATVDPFDAKRRYMEFTSVVRLENKYLALSVQGTIVVMQDLGLRLVITSISTCRGVPSGTWRFFKQYLVELNGEILLVFLIHRKSVQVVDQVEVFGLDVVKFEWIKVERIQGKTLFLGEKCIWSNSGEVCKGNCVYFTQGCDNGWWVYDMETCCILPA